MSQNGRLVIDMTMVLTAQEYQAAARLALAITNGQISETVLAVFPLKLSSTKLHGIPRES